MCVVWPKRPQKRGNLKWHKTKTNNCNSSSSLELSPATLKQQHKKQRKIRTHTHTIRECNRESSKLNNYSHIVPAAISSRNEAIDIYLVKVHPNKHTSLTCVCVFFASSTSIPLSLQVYCHDWVHKQWKWYDADKYRFRCEIQSCRLLLLLCHTKERYPEVNDDGATIWNTA